MSFLRLEQLAKTFPDGTEAVRGIDLAIDDGEFVVLLGPSGCGKTTTLRMIAGLEQPTAGRVHVDGADVTGRRPSQRDVAFVFQFYGLYPHLSVRENIGFPLECAGVSRAERAGRVEQVAERMGLSSLLDRRPRHLAGGDQQRVALARAMIRRPRVFLMDEPLGTLDADRRLEMRELIRAQQIEMGVATVYVTHDQEEAMSLADRIAVMDDGRIRQVDAPMVVYGEPADLFVANFVGSPGMNFLPGRIETAEGARTFIADDCRIPLAGSCRPGPVTLGIRPEFIRLDADGPVAAEVVMDAYEGTCHSLHVRTAFADDLIVRTAANDPHPAGERLRLAFDAGHIRFFDPDGGRRVG